MSVWPSIQEPSYPLKESIYKRQIKNEFESGHVLSRPASTVSKRRWTLEWTFMPESDYQTLETFFTANVGLSFTWTHPVTLSSYTVRFMDSEMTGDIPSPNRRKVSIGIEEVP